MTYRFARVRALCAGAALAAMVAAAPLAHAQDDAVVATVDGQPVTEAQLQLAISELGQQFAQLPDAQKRAAALTSIIEIRLMADVASEQGLGEDAEFQQRMEFLRERALHSAYIEAEIASQVTEETMRARYDEEMAQIEPANEVRARHIIVETEEEAAALIEQLNDGADFEELAREHSTDGAAAQGGDLGYFGPGQMVGEFEEAAFAMNVGDHSAEPVQTQFGWHVIKLEDRRAQTPPAFEQVMPQLRSMMLREVYLERANALRDAAAIEIADEGLRELIQPEDAGEDAETTE